MSGIRRFPILLVVIVAFAQGLHAAQLPRVLVPTPTNTVTLTTTLALVSRLALTSTNTVTPSLPPTEALNEATLIVQGNLTNEAGMATLAAMWTQMAASPTFTPTFTPSPQPSFTPAPAITEILMTPGLPNTPLALLTVATMEPLPLYARSVANLRICPHTDCPRITQLRPGDSVLQTGVIDGEAVHRGSTLWYRVEYAGRQVYVYNSLMTTTQPTATPTILAPGAG